MMRYRALFPSKYQFLGLHPAVVELRGLRGPSGVAWKRRRLSGAAAAAAQEVPDDGRNRKRVSRKERRAVVEDYVNKYRMLNGGKFPTASNARKELGGGYYFVRSIIQELEYNSTLPTVAMVDVNSIEGQTDKVNGISPSSSNEINGISEVNAIPFVNIEESDKTVDWTDQTNGTSEVRVASDSDMPVGKIVVSDNYRTPADDSSSSQGEAINISGHTIVDTPVLNIEVSTKDENSTVGRTDQTNGTSEIREVIDDMLVGKSIVSDNYGIPADDGPSSEGEASNNSDRRMTDVSDVTNYNEVSATDEPSIVGQTAKVEEISEGDSELHSKSGHPSEVPVAGRNTELGKIDVASSQASESNQSTGERTQNEPQETSLWGNLKSLASSIISIWRK